MHGIPDIAAFTIGRAFARARRLIRGCARQRRSPHELTKPPPPTPRSPPACVLNACRRVSGAPSSSSSGSRRPTILTRPPRDAARDQHDDIERQRRALLRRVIEMDVEIIGQRLLGLLLLHGHAIDLGKLAQRMLAGDREIAEQMRIGRRAAAACRRRSGRAPRPFPAAPADRCSRRAQRDRPRRATGCAGCGSPASASTRTGSARGGSTRLFGRTG